MSIDMRLMSCDDSFGWEVLLLVNLRRSPWNILPGVEVEEHKFAEGATIVAAMVCLINYDRLHVTKYQ